MNPITSPFNSETFRVKVGLAEMLKGGVIMDVVTAEQARIAEDAGAVAVMALERVPADIRREGGVARMSEVSLIKEIMAAVTGVPTGAKLTHVRPGVSFTALPAESVNFVGDEAESLDQWPFVIRPPERIQASPVPASPLERIRAAPSEMRRRASPRLVAPQTKGVVKAHLSTWWASSAGVRTSDSST